MIASQALAQPGFEQAGKKDFTSSKQYIPYIDAHNHLFGGRDARTGYVFAARTAVQKKEALKIQHMLIMPPPIGSAHQPNIDLKDLFYATKQYPDQFSVLGGGESLNIMIHESQKSGNVSASLKKRFRTKALEIISLGVVGLGEFAAEHFSFNSNHPYESVSPDHPLFLLLSDIAAEYDKPIDLHMEAIPYDMPLPDRHILKRSGNNPKHIKGNIAAFERLLKHNRKAKIIWAHVGWCNTGFRTTELCRELFNKHPNLYMSFKISPESVPEVRPIGKDRKALKPEWLQLVRDFPNRFIIGTDQFYSPPGGRRIGPQKTEATRLLVNLLPPDLAVIIGMDNPRRIFNLKSVPAH